MEGSTLWILAGMVLIIGEMLSAGFFLLFIALGCFASALAATLGYSIVVQGIVCAMVSVGGIFLLRKPIQKKLLQNIKLAADVGKEIHIDQEMPPHQQTRISYQGTSWLATNLDPEKIKQGDRVVIVGIDGNILLIRKVT